MTRSDVLDELLAIAVEIAVQSVPDDDDDDARPQSRAARGAA
jgi:hypothetical protein